MKLATADDEEDAAAMIFRTATGPAAKAVGGAFWINAKTEKQCSVLENASGDNYVLNTRSCYGFGVLHNAFCEFNSKNKFRII